MTNESKFKKPAPVWSDRFRAGGCCVGDLVRGAEHLELVRGSGCPDDCGDRGVKCVRAGM